LAIGGEGEFDMNSNQESIVGQVRTYWEGHTLGLQYVKDPTLVPGTREFFDHIQPWMNPFKFPEIMPRIDKYAARLSGKQLLEVGCGMGFDSIEFMRRGVRVTATDLTQSAVDMTRRHFEVKGFEAEAVMRENILALSFPAESFDAVWACGVIHHTGDIPGALSEIARVLRPGGFAMISHLYRRPSWMYFISRLGRENIEFKEEDAPITEFLTEPEVLRLFSRFAIEETVRDHYRALPIARTGWKAALYTNVFRPTYNLLPRRLAEHLAYKFSVVAAKRAG
jgi:2-polyprenyl-3-methyl-5-hydroxy-6-metoxy-1,4-benzoquinol methylase